MLIGINNAPFNACDIVATWLDGTMADIGWRELVRNRCMSTYLSRPLSSFLLSLSFLDGGVDD
jgi:hypothetical protein